MVVGFIKTLNWFFCDHILSFHLILNFHMFIQVLAYRTFILYYILWVFEYPMGNYIDVQQLIINP